MRHGDHMTTTTSTSATTSTTTPSPPLTTISTTGMEMVPESNPNLVGGIYTPAGSRAGSRKDDDDDDADSQSSAGGSVAQESVRAILSAEATAAQHLRALYISRIVIAVSMLIFGTAAAFATYFLTGKTQRETFEIEFHEMAEEVVLFADLKIQNIKESLQAVSYTMTGMSTSQRAQWPYHTHTDFEVLGSSVLENTGSEFISWSPIISGEDELHKWGEYSTNHSSWLDETLQWIETPTRSRPDIFAQQRSQGVNEAEVSAKIPPEIFTFDKEWLSEPVPESGSGPFVPLWQHMAKSKERIHADMVNFNLLSDSSFRLAFDELQAKQGQVLSAFFNGSSLFYYEENPNEEASSRTIPHSVLMTPIIQDFDKTTTKVVGVIMSLLQWDMYFRGVLPEDASGVVVVLRDGACGNQITFEIDGSQVTLRGAGDLHDPKYTPYGVVHPLTEFTVANSECPYTMIVYPSDDLRKEYSDDRPKLMTIFVVAIFALMAIMFLSYDCFVQQRQHRVISSAAKSNAIVSSLFPEDIRDRLFNNDDRKRRGSLSLPESSKFRLKNYLYEEGGSGPLQVNQAIGDEPMSDEEKQVDVYDSKPIADLFPNTTVMFADIAGFTAWSSVREPSQVFTLLETVYQAFDAIAKRRRVFKVETVGDCYVAVTGLPEPRKDHAVAMAKFARECLDKFNELAKQLELSLGPDTAELAMRAGLHSGPVTAGVLRGDKSRFQLFGDTVNTAARVESTGQRNRVHLSSETARLLRMGGKEHWLKKRDGTVTAKGKGEMQTYWLQSPQSDPSQIIELGPDKDAGIDTLASSRLTDASLHKLEESLSPKIQRLVGWNVEILKKLLQQILAKRNAVSNRRSFDQQLSKLESEIVRQMNCLDEVTEIIALPKFDHKAHRNKENPNKIEIPEKVVEQLRLYVSAVAAMHRDNPFHNFEHASHVTMSVSKLLSRIVAPDEVLNAEGTSNIASTLHDHTYGITSDPLTQFAVVLSALIHDTDHLGVSNFQLIKEDHKLAKFFKEKSIAEQNSIVLAWEKLMSPRFADLRRAIYSHPSELKRFRQLVVNNVLATDIFDKELSTLRRNRWDKAFQKFQVHGTYSPEDDVNRKATIVMEHLIQASDVAHTMQHWHIYQKWNERLFLEMSVAYEKGRMDKNPADGWYQGELGFFDNYIIPLAKKLKECGVFGVSSDEYLNYALENRREWSTKGEEVVAKYIEKFSKNKDGASGVRSGGGGGTSINGPTSKHSSDDLTKSMHLPDHTGFDRKASLSDR